MSIATNARARHSRARRFAVSIVLAGAAVVAGTVVTGVGHAQVAHSPSPAAEGVIGLQYGSYGDGVRAVQRALIRSGVRVFGGADGYFGRATLRAVKSFQAREGLRVTGMVDQPTAEALGVSTPAAPVALTGAGPMAQGARGDRVRQLQQALVNAGITVPGGVDGIFGPGTASAVRAYQQSRGLAVTGTGDSATMSALARRAPALTSGDTLRQGARGDRVRQLQQALVNAGITVPGGVDGIFGPGTASAVRAYQRSRGLAVTGNADDATMSSLARRAPAAAAAPRSSGAAPRSSGPLAQGARGAAVRQLQQALVNAGIQVPGGVDGIFGPGTESAVKAYQRSRGLAVTGRADSATTNALANRTPALTSRGPLAQGARGDAVRQLQQALINAGVRVGGGADGIFGPATEAAVRAYQRSRGLPMTGRADSATMNALARRAPAEAPSAPSRPSRPSRPSSRRLSQGARGDAVRRLQQALMNAGITVPGGADGVFGPATEGAVRAYQRSRGLAVTGRAGPTTLTALARRTPALTSRGPLAVGSRGPAVAQLQRALMHAGITVPGGADGVFGPATEGAVRQYQSSRGLTVTGRADSATLSALARGVRRRSSGGGSPGGGGPTAEGFARFDERGARVIALQQALVNAGIPLRGGVDGVFGSATSGAVMQFQRRRGLQPTGRVDRATASALGLSAMPAPSSPSLSVRIQHEPVESPCWFGDTWLAPRGGGRVHLGVDIIADRGQRLYAVSSGTITQIYRDSPGSLSGNGLKLTRSDGTYFFYAHLERFARGIRTGTSVGAGQVVGYVGSTGNSATPHLHLEVHPGGGSAVNPTPIVRAVGAC